MENNIKVGDVVYWINTHKVFPIILKGNVSEIYRKLGSEEILYYIREESSGMEIFIDSEMLATEFKIVKEEFMKITENLRVNAERELKKIDQFLQDYKKVNFFKGHNELLEKNGFLPK